METFIQNYAAPSKLAFLTQHLQPLQVYASLYRPPIFAVISRWLCVRSVLDFLNIDVAGIRPELMKIHPSHP
jgi:hypothetical protein